MIRCKSCGNIDRSYQGYCQKCYIYFIRNKFEVFKDEVEYGKLSFVKDETSKQYGMPICHICGKAYIKLQQHIYNAHHMFKNEYCNQFGLDKKIRMTTNEYNKKMHDYALQYNMGEQVKKVGKKTRFKKGQSNIYERSYMTMQRLKKYGKEMGYKNLKNTK